MRNQRENSHDNTVADLGREAVWFLTHTLIALLLLAIVIGVMSLNHPDPDSPAPKQLATILALLVPLVGSFLLARIHHNGVAGSIWISGLAIFSVVFVWVLDLPTGNGLCGACGAGEKVWRTFFSFTNGSGLMAGDGLLVGAWIPLSMIGYAIGAKLALNS
jgi:hypothetical protein